MATASLCVPNATSSLHISSSAAASRSLSLAGDSGGLRFGCSIRPSPSPRARRRAAPPSPAERRITVRCGAVTTIGESEFSGEVLASDLPVLVEFVAEWCGPCRLISPVIEWASQEYKGRVKIVKIDHDANPRLIEEYKVYGLPCLILFKNEQEVPGSRREGAITKVKLKEYLDSLLGSTTVV